jgi:hypothetical protein
MKKGAIVERKRTETREDTDTAGGERISADDEPYYICGLSKRAANIFRIRILIVSGDGGWIGRLTDRVYERPKSITVPR